MSEGIDGGRHVKHTIEIEGNLRTCTNQTGANCSFDSIFGGRAAVIFLRACARARKNQTSRPPALVRKADSWAGRRSLRLHTPLHLGGGRDVWFARMRGARK